MAGGHGYATKVAVADRRIYASMSKRFRRARNAALATRIGELGSPRILDVGGMPDFWATVSSGSSAAEIVILNSGSGEYSSPDELMRQHVLGNMRLVSGDACDLEFPDKDFDLVVCNSVLEHVGGWERQRLAASELSRVARSGWVQVPAYEFPLEVHYMRPFVHWVSEPGRAALLRWTVRRFRGMSPEQFRTMFINVSLLSGKEMSTLFPDAEIHSERFLGFTKSHIATW